MAPSQASTSAPRNRAAQATSRDTVNNNADKVVNARSAKIHKRSRDGCFTCRLRRKKCSETHPKCDACTSLDIPCQYARPDCWRDEAEREAQLGLISERIRMGKVAKPGSAQSRKPSKAQTSAQRQIQSSQAQEVQALIPSPLLQPNEPNKGTSSDEGATLPGMSNDPFDESVGANGLDIANGLDMTNGFAYEDGTSSNVYDPCAVLHSSGFITGSFDVDNTNYTTQLEEPVLDRNNMSASGFVPDPEENYVGDLDSDAPSQFYAGDAEELQGDLMWQEAYGLGQPGQLLDRDVYD